MSGPHPDQPAPSLPGEELRHLVVPDQLPGQAGLSPCSVRACLPEQAVSLARLGRQLAASTTAWATAGTTWGSKTLGMM